MLVSVSFSSERKSERIERKFKTQIPIPSDSSSSENDRKNSKKATTTKSSVKRPKTPTKAKKVLQAKSTSKKAKKDDNQPIYSKNTSDTSSEGESSEDSEAAEKRPIKAKNKSKAAQGKIFSFYACHLKVI